MWQIVIWKQQKMKKWKKKRIFCVAREPLKNIVQKQQEKCCNSDQVALSLVLAVVPVIVDDGKLTALRVGVPVCMCALFVYLCHWLLYGCWMLLRLLSVITNTHRTRKEKEETFPCPKLLSRDEGIFVNQNHEKSSSHDTQHYRIGRVVGRHLCVCVCVMYSRTLFFIRQNVNCLHSNGFDARHRRSEPINSGKKVIKSSW